MGKQLLGSVFPAGRAKASSEEPGKEPGIQGGSEKYKAKKMFRGYSEASRAGEVGWTEGEEELPGWLAPASSSQGLMGPSSYVPSS